MKKTFILILFLALAAGFNNAGFSQIILTIGGSFTAANPTEYDGSVYAPISEDHLTLLNVSPDHTAVSLNAVFVFTNKSVGNGKTISLIGSTLTGDDKGFYTLSLVGAPTGTADVIPKDLTITGASTPNKIYNGNRIAIISGAVLAGQIEGDSVALDALVGNFSQANIGEGLEVVGALTLKGADKDNYTLSQPGGLYANIISKELTVTGAVAVDKQYDGTNIASISGSVLNGKVGSEDVSLDALTGTFAGADVGNTIAVTAALTIKGAAIGNYTLTQPGSLEADITKKTLTIRAENKSKCYNGEVYNGGFTVSFSGFANSENEYVLSGTPAFSGTALTAVNSGNYVITPGGYTSSNYNITFQDGTLAIGLTPTVTSASTGTICSGSAQNYDITSGVEGTTFSWGREEVIGITNSVVAGKTSDPITEVLINTSEAAINVVYLITPSANSCTGAQFTYTVTVNPVPATPVAITGASSHCPSSAGQTYSVAAVTNATTYTWTVPTGWSVTDGAGTRTITLTSGALGQDGNISVTAGNACGTSSARTLGVSINPITAGGTASSNQTICTGTEPANITLSEHTGNVLKWQKSTDIEFTSPTDIAVTSSTLSGATIGELSTGTYFRAVVQSGNCSVAYSTSVLVSVTIRMNIKVMLEGAVNGSEMNALIRSHIPLVQPYGNVSPFNYTGTETLATIPAGMVDWVLIELRQGVGPDDATSLTILDKRAALLMSNGNIVDLDGISYVDFGNHAFSNSLYVVIRHRNHLAIMSSDHAEPNNGAYCYDFTTDVTRAFGSSSGYKQAGATYAMVTGDISKDGYVFVTDYNGWASDFGKTGGYYDSDFTLDGNVFVTDYNKWATNFGITVLEKIKSLQLKPKYFSRVPK